MLKTNLLPWIRSYQTQLDGASCFSIRTDYGTSSYTADTTRDLRKRYQRPHVLYSRIIIPIQFIVLLIPIYSLIFYYSLFIIPIYYYCNYYFPCSIEQRTFHMMHTRQRAWFQSVALICLTEFDRG